MSKQTIVRILVVAGVAILVAGVVVLKIRDNKEESSANQIASAPQTEVSEPVAAVAMKDVVPAEKVSSPVSTAKTTTKIPDEPLALTKSLDLATFLSYGVPVVIDFGADSCIPCKEMAPVLVALHDELKGKAIIRFVDVWKYRELAEGIPLQVIPTQVFFDAAGKPFTPPESLGIPFTRYSMKDTGEHVFTTHEGGLSKEQLLAIIDAMGTKK